MKPFHFLIIILFFFTNCESKSSNKIEKDDKDTINANKNTVIGEKNIEIKNEIPEITKSASDSLIAKFNILFYGSKKVIQLDKSKLFMSNYKTLNKLYYLNDIKRGIAIQSQNSIEVSELYYKDLHFSKKVFNNIKVQLVDKNNEFEEGNYFFDYFKKGTVYILDDKKIIAITYNPFIAPKNDKIVTNFINKNKKYFDSIIRTYMIGSYETIN